MPLYCHHRALGFSLGHLHQAHHPVFDAYYCLFVLAHRLTTHLLCSLLCSWGNGPVSSLKPGVFPCPGRRPSSDPQPDRINGHRAQRHWNLSVTAPPPREGGREGAVGEADIEPSPGPFMSHLTYMRLCCTQSHIPRVGLPPAVRNFHILVVLFPGASHVRAQAPSVIFLPRGGESSFHGWGG
jgi:hypothetical protein